jgi:hypothetical protein
MKIQKNKKAQEERKLEDLILEGINSGLPTPLTHDDFEAIQERGFERVKSKAEEND